MHRHLAILLLASLLSVTTAATAQDDRPEDGDIPRPPTMPDVSLRLDPGRGPETLTLWMDVIDPSGNIHTGEKEIRFCLFRQMSGGVPDWCEIHTVVLPDDGDLRITLGNQTPLQPAIDWRTPRFLEMTVTGDVPIQRRMHMFGGFYQDWAARRQTVVDCDRNGSLNRAMEQGHQIIFVRGTCREDVYVSRDDTHIQALPEGATVIGAGNTTTKALEVNGANRVVIHGLTVIGADDGIEVIGDGQAAIINVEATGERRFGIAVRQNAFAYIKDSLIHASSRGIWVTKSSSALIENNEIVDNRAYGIEVAHGSEADIGYIEPRPEVYSSSVYGYAVRDIFADGVSLFVPHVYDVSYRTGNRIADNDQGAVLVREGSSASLMETILRGNARGPLIAVRAGSSLNLKGGNTLVPAGGPAIQLEQSTLHRFTSNARPEVFEATGPFTIIAQESDVFLPLDITITGRVPLEARNSRVVLEDTSRLAGEATGAVLRDGATLVLNGNTRVGGGAFGVDVDGLSRVTVSDAARVDGGIAGIALRRGSSAFVEGRATVDADRDAVVLGHGTQAHIARTASVPAGARCVSPTALLYWAPPDPGLIRGCR